MTRRIQADPDYPNKLMSSRVSEIAPCTACDTCLGANARCRINPFLGAEYNTIDKAPRRKKVVVVGGGPAGMEAARVSALRGHDVTLFEKANKLGGLLHIAATVKGDHPEDLLSIVRYFESQLRRLKVNVKLSKKADLYGILEEKPDAVIIAIGGSTVIPKITGISSRHVVNGAELHRKLRFFLKVFEPRTLRFLSRFFMPLGKRVAIIGGSLHGCELAEFLTKRGRKVTIIESSDSIGKGMVDLLLNHLMVWFQKKGVVLKTSVEQIEIVPKGVAIVMRDGSTSVIEVDTVVPAVPLSADSRPIRQP